MTDSEVLVFGSFTKDEIKKIQNQSPRSTSQSPEKKELQFGSLDVATIRALTDLSVDPKKNGVSEGSKSDRAPKLTRDEEAAVKTANDDLQSVSATMKENGSVIGYPNGSSIGNGVTDLKRTSGDLPSSHIAQNNAAPKQSVWTGLGNGILTSNALPKQTLHKSDVTTSVKDLHKASNGGTLAVKGLLPRGLINPGNLCFLNATLQALLSCSPFVQLLQELRTRDLPKMENPTLHAFVEFISQFDMPADSNSKKTRMVVHETGISFLPAMFEPILRKFTPDLPNSISGRPRQEDAQEFLSFVMDQMHNESLKGDGNSSSSNGGNLATISSSEDDGWVTVGPKNKSAVTRTQSFTPSKLSDIFGGKLKSVVKARGNTPSATIQPYLLLHLDIFPDAVRNVEDALHLFSAPETLEGYKPSAAGKVASVSASKSIKIETLPKIMILHLMRFSYGSRGSTKLHKSVWFPLELVLGRELLVSPSSEGRRYELVATITHHGRDPFKGHYTADTRYSDGQWLRYDDASVTAVGTNKVLHDQAYLLFYKQV